MFALLRCRHYSNFVVDVESSPFPIAPLTREWSHSLPVHLSFGSYVCIHLRSHQSMPLSVEKRLPLLQAPFATFPRDFPPELKASQSYWYVLGLRSNADPSRGFLNYAPHALNVHKTECQRRYCFSKSLIIIEFQYEYTRI